jgi:GNAT superfamily N-acetyltransferase
MRPAHTLPPAQSENIIDVLCDAFFNYPVMRFVLGGMPDYSRRLRTLVGLFVAARVAREDLMLGVHDSAGALVATALVNLPGGRLPPPAFESYRQLVWAELGGEERVRYEAYGTTSNGFHPDEPHHHLGMIGVRRSHHGQGLSRLLLDHLHAVVDADPGSGGVSLNTELPRNVTLYEHFGYRITGHARVGPGLETWAFFRPSGGAAGGRG